MDDIYNQLQYAKQNFVTPGQMNIDLNEVGNNFESYRSTHEAVMSVYKPIIYTIGILANMILIFVILKNKPLRTRPNIILANWAICNFFILFQDSLFHWVLPYNSPMANPCDIIFKCITRQVDEAYYQGCVLFMLLLLHKSIINNENIELKKILTVVYGFIALNLFILDYIYCNFSFFGVQGFTILVVFTLLASLILCFMLFSSEVKICLKKTKRFNDHNERIRLNIVRIFVYNWIFSFSFTLINQMFNLYNTFSDIAKFTLLFSDLNSAFILLYLCFADNGFKNACKAILKRPVKEVADTREDELEETASVEVV